jgi:receptor expression-enhancing protein 1/2/3/4
MLIDLLWTILNKTPITKQPEDAREGQPGQQPYSLESVKGLWTSYGPAIMGALSKSSTKPSSSPDAAAKQATYASGVDVNYDGEQIPETHSQST